jgi:hypothetical protein
MPLVGRVTPCEPLRDLIPAGRRLPRATVHLFEITLEVLLRHLQIASSSIPLIRSVIPAEAARELSGKAIPPPGTAAKLFGCHLLAAGFQSDSARIVICAAIMVGSKFRSSNSCALAHRNPKSSVKASIAAHLEHKTTSPGWGFRSWTAYLRTLSIR